jgi:hypothetical protein
MGTRVAPSMANFLMAVIDKQIQNCAVEENLSYI